MEEMETMFTSYGIDIRDENGDYKDCYTLLCELAEKINKVESD